MILTVARTHNVVGAKPSQLDLVDRTWTIRAPDLKGVRGRRKRDHVVPLSERALSIVCEQPEGAYLFIGDEPGEPLSGAAMAAVIDRMNEEREANGLPKWIDPKLDREIVPHGFRSCFKDWASEQTDYPNEMSEMALAHTVSDKVEAAYRRGDMRERRRRLMADWEKFCASPLKVRRAVADDRVVALHRFPVDPPALGRRRGLTKSE